MAGAVGLKVWEVLAQRRSGGGSGRGDGGGGGGGDGGGTAKGGEVEGSGGEEVGGGQIEGAAVVTEEAVGVQQAKIQALEDQLAVSAWWFFAGCSVSGGGEAKRRRRVEDGVFSRIVLRGDCFSGMDGKNGLARG